MPTKMMHYSSNASFIYRAGVEKSRGHPYIQKTGMLAENSGKKSYKVPRFCVVGVA